MDDPLIIFTSVRQRIQESHSPGMCAGKFVDHFLTVHWYLQTDCKRTLDTVSSDETSTVFTRLSVFDICMIFVACAV